MTAKLKLELDNQTGKGFGQIVADLDRVGGSAQGASQAIDGLNATLGAGLADAMAQQLGALSAEYDATMDSAQQLTMAEEGLEGHSPQVARLVRRMTKRLRG